LIKGATQIKSLISVLFVVVSLSACSSSTSQLSTEELPPKQSSLPEDDASKVHLYSVALQSGQFDQDPKTKARVFILRAAANFALGVDQHVIDDVTSALAINITGPVLEKHIRSASQWPATRRSSALQQRSINP
jgi:hypothetical protein